MPNELNGEWPWLGDDPGGILTGRGPGEVAVDTETTGLDFPDRILGISLAWRTGSAYRTAYLYSPEGQMPLEGSLLTKGAMPIGEVIKKLYHNNRLIFHNEPFDVRALYRVFPWSPGGRAESADTMHLARTVAWQDRLSLAFLYAKYVDALPKEYLDLKAKRNQLQHLDLQTVSDYARRDARHTLELYEVLRPKITDESLYESDRKYARLVMQLIRQGLTLNRVWYSRTEKWVREEIIAVERQLRGLGLVDPGSNPAVATFLFKVLDLPHQWSHLTASKNRAWPAGIPSVDADTLDAVAGMHPAAGLVKRHRQLTRAYSEWVIGFRQHASIDGRVHALLDPFGTVSSRMAASHPNVMAIPMEDRGAAFGSMQGMFTGMPEGKLMACDFSQVEVRLAAVQARETGLLEILSNKQDPYLLMAERIWGDKTQRNKAKRATLAAIYDIGAETFAAANHVSMEEAYQILQDFRRAFPRIPSMSKFMAHQASLSGKVVLHTGRPRWFGPGDEGYKAFNQVVQGNVAEIIKHAMLLVSEIGRLQLQIHDSLIVVVPPGQRVRMKKEITEAMREAVPAEFRQKVAFPVAFKNWG